MLALLRKPAELWSRSHLRLRVARGGAWLGALNGVESVLRIARNVLLARILAPDAFGVLAVVLAVSAAFESFTEIGIRQAVVQNPRGGDEAFLNGAWWLSAGRAVVLYVAGFCAAPLVASIYANPGLVPLIRVAFLNVLFNGLISAKAYVAVKQMDFRRWGLIVSGGNVCGVVVGLAAAWAMRSVWGLVIGLVAEGAFRCALSYALAPYRPGWRVEREHLASLLRFTRGMVGLPILYFVFMRTDVFVLGKLTTAAALGLYTMASALARAPGQFVDSLMAQVGMPAFSELQGQNERTNRALVQVTAAVVAIGAPGAVFAALYAREILGLAYGEAYVAAAVPFAIMAATGILQTANVPVATLYFSIGRPELQRVCSIVRVIVLLALIVPLSSRFGLSGAAASVAAATVIGYAVQLWWLRRLTGLTARRYLRVFVSPLAWSGVIGGTWIVTRPTLSDGQPITALVAGALACLSAYALIAASWSRNAGRVAAASGWEACA